MKQTESMKVRTTYIVKILKGDLDTLNNLTELKIEANYYLNYLEPGLFKNLSRLEQLSISFNNGLKVLHEGTFDGLINLKNLTLVNNLFTSIPSLTSLLKPNILPSLNALDLSENPFENVTINAFSPMKGSQLTSLGISLSRLEYIHPDSFLPLIFLKKLHIAQNNLNTSFISEFLLSMCKNHIELTYIDLSGMGFHKQPPRNLTEIIARTTISRLIMADNRFEVINDDTFPTMPNIEELNLRRVSAMYVSPNAFDPIKFPNLQVLLLSGNNLRGIYQINRPGYHLAVLDLSSSGDHTRDEYYYEIAKNSFINFNKLRVLNLSRNAVKAIHNYTFEGLDNLRILNLENSSVYCVENGSFRATKHLKYLNLANNKLGHIINVTGNTFDGLKELKVLILRNCGINRIDERDNLFEKMPNISVLILSKNLLRCFSPKILKPLKKLELIDLSENLLIAWASSLFLVNGVQPSNVYFANNKIVQFTDSMLLDIKYLLENKSNSTALIDLSNNLFNCDCNSMYQTFIWLEKNGSQSVNEYILSSNFLCNNPGKWDRRLSTYLKTITTLQCASNTRSLTLLIWSAPTLITVVLFILLITLLYKYRVYIRYCIFISKVALGRKFTTRSLTVNTLENKVYKYDAFVSYCNEDKNFVAKMVAQLETSPPHLKLCIYERDFEIGSFISESVSNSINESRYIILVISNNFARSQWCRWETQIAEYHRLFLEDGSLYDPLVLIKLGNIESKYLTTTLKYLMKTKIYHAWDEEESQEFWEKLRRVLMKK